MVDEAHQRQPQHSPTHGGDPVKQRPGAGIDVAANASKHAPPAPPLSSPGPKTMAGVWGVMAAEGIFVGPKHTIFVHVVH